MKRKKSRQPKPARSKRSVTQSRKTGVAIKPARASNVDLLVAANAKALGLTVRPAWKKSVAFNLGLIMRHAALVDQFPLPDESEPAPVYSP